MSETPQTDNALVPQDEEQDPTIRVLDQLGALQRAIAQARDVSETLPLKDAAVALRFLSRQLGLDRDIQNEAALACITAERKLGDLLADMPKNAGGNPNWLHDETGLPMTYEDLGIDKTAAHRWQTMARLPDDKFAAFVDELKDSRRELTSGAVYQYARNVEGKGGKGMPEPLVKLDTLWRNWEGELRLAGIAIPPGQRVRIVVMPLPDKGNGEDTARPDDWPTTELPASLQEDNTFGWMHS